MVNSPPLPNPLPLPKKKEPCVFGNKKKSFLNKS